MKTYIFKNSLELIDLFLPLLGVLYLFSFLTFEIVRYFKVGAIDFDFLDFLALATAFAWAIGGIIAFKTILKKHLIE